MIGNANSAEQCPAVSCDCDAIPNPDWVGVCRQHETRMKKACIANSNTPRNFCLVHGPNAQPLPLAIEFSEIELGEADFNTLRARARESVGSVTTSFELVNTYLGRKEYLKTMRVLKIMDAKVGDLFEQYQKIEATLLATDRGKKVRASWNSFSKEMLEVAIQLDEIVSTLVADMEQGRARSDKKKLSVLAQQALRIAGKTYEYGGYALGRAERHRQAADAWEGAADVAVRLAVVGVASNIDTKKSEYAEYQAATRLHRASYHWLLGEDIKGAHRTLKESQMYIDRSDQKLLATLLENADGGAKEAVLTDVK